MRNFLIVLQVTVLCGASFTLGMMVDQPTPMTSSLATQREGELVKPTAYNDTVTISWVTDEVAVEEKLLDYEQRYGVKARALAYPFGDTCFIYSREPEYSTDGWVTTLGHETLHCFRGNWHE